MSLTAPGVRQLLDHETLPDPYAFYGQLQQEMPIFWDEGISAWVLTRYDDCVAVLRDSDRFCSDFRRLGEDVPEALLSVQSLDPPEHTEIRHLMLDAFRTDTTDWTQNITSDVCALLQEVKGGKQVDLVTEFAEPLALRTVSRLLGNPALSCDFVSVSHRVVDAMDAGLRPEVYEPGVDARAELAHLTSAWLDDPPAAGLVATLAERVDRSNIDRSVVANTLRTVLHAGFESASRFLSSAILALLRRPGGLKSVALDNVRAAAEELARYVGPVQADSRGCVHDTTVAGQRIKKGQVVTLLLGAANRDPRKFDEPGILHLDRSPNHHLAFGRGVHACLGASIALRLGEATLNILCRHHPEMRLLADPVFRPNATLRGLQRMEATI